MNHFTKKNFSLIEVLVAVAVLVIMMGFIFQFSNGAQRLWASNTARTEMAAQADGVFNLLQQDFEGMYVMSEEEDLDAQGTYYYKTKSGGEQLADFCFFTKESDAGGADPIANFHGIRYHFEISTDENDKDAFGKQNGKLYRFETNDKVWNRICDLDWDDSTPRKPQTKINVTEGGTASNVTAEDPKWYCPIPDSKEEFLVAEHIQSIRFMSDAKYDEEGNEITANPFTIKPKFFRITITFFVPERLHGDTKTSEDDGLTRTFSRVFFLEEEAE